MATALLTGIYTLTPTHCGTGQTSGAVDLPIARESHTGLPVLPASGLKGAARALLNEKDNENDKKLAEYLFGSELGPTGKGGGSSNGTKAGNLVMLEGRLLFYPVRSLQRPFLYATCPMILARLGRDLRALGLEELLDPRWRVPNLTEGNAPAVVLSDKELVGKVLVVEDFVYKGDEVGQFMSGEAVAKLAGSLLPPEEQETAERIRRNLVLMSDRDFTALLERAVPVQARIRLSRETNTTSGEGGNLWYEETLPSDCVFTMLLTNRAGRDPAKGAWSPMEEFQNLLKRRKAIQIGGNETVGQGFCWWTAARAKNEEVSGAPA